MHKKITKKSAGIIFSSITILTLITQKNFTIEIPYFFPVIFGLFFTTTLGLLDDIYKLSSNFRFISEILFFGFLSYYFLPDFQIFGIEFHTKSSLGIAILTLYFVFLVNLANFMDGIDLYLSLTFIVTILNFFLLKKSFAFQNEYAYLFLLCSLCGFLIFNYPPAKLFMGDCGSLPIGFMIAIFPFFLQETKTTEITNIFFFIPVFLTDGVITILKRLSQKKNLFVAHREHLFQKISDIFFTRKQTAFFFSLANLFSGFLYFLFSDFSIYLLFTINSAFFLLMYLYFHTKTK